MTTSKFWSIDEVALQLSVSRSTVVRWVQAGKLVGQKAGAQWRFDPTMVLDALRQGKLSGGHRPLNMDRSLATHRDVPEWASHVVAIWRQSIEGQLPVLKVDHVITNDRRGAKIWGLLLPNRFVLGKNLWHSTAVQLMTSVELRKIFGGKSVLLFDEMMQHGRELNELRRKLEAKGINATVTSFVCVRRRSHAESGDLLEYRSLCCEDLDDSEFAERAALISRLCCFFEPPLDVDHIVVKGSFAPGLGTDDFLERATKWARPFVVWFPDEEHEFMAITLDRPQFFDTKNSELPKGFSFGWNNPGKIRIYGGPEDKTCYCSFIIYPDMEGPVSEWVRLAADVHQTRKSLENENERTFSSQAPDEETLNRTYVSVCVELAIRLLRDFVESGAAEEIGIHFDNAHDAIDLSQLQATFGINTGLRISKEVREILAGATRGHGLFPQVAQNPMPVAIRHDNTPELCSRNLFECRAELLRAIPQRYSSDDKEQRPVSWSELLRRLPQFSESTIGRVFDNDLDTGAAKPTISFDYSSRDGVETIKGWRGFCRGEFGPWFEWHRTVLGHDDLEIQRTLGWGPMVVEHFLKRTGETKISATHFDKVFANLQHDLVKNVDDLFYIGWRPYKYGPVPVVPVIASSGDYKEFQQFLVELKCLDRKRERHGSVWWNRYEPMDEASVPWRELYRIRVSPHTKAHVAGLIRLYAAIQQECHTERPSSPEASEPSNFRDALVALATARNQKTAYRCGWFEVNDWIGKGRLLFGLMGGVAVNKVPPDEPFLKENLENFASPATLLFFKIEMYRNMPQLRKQIVSLLGRGDLEAAEVLLATTDESPRFESQSEYPMANLEWACGIMRTFSSMTRQVLTACHLDLDQRPEKEKMDGKGALKDSSYYLGQLLDSCPELVAMESQLRKCVAESQKGQLNETISGALSQTFYLILSIFESQQRIPDPRPSWERNKERGEARSDLITSLLGISIPQPYCVAIADIRNLRNLPRVSEWFGTSYDEAMAGLLARVTQLARDIADHHQTHFAGLTGDSVIFAGSNSEKVFLAINDLIKETMQRLNETDRNQFALFGLLRAGAAWRDDRMSNEYKGVRPGLVAYDLANVPGQALGAINVTKPILDRLSPQYQGEFVPLLRKDSCEQEKEFVRYWKS